MNLLQKDFAGLPGSYVKISQAQLETCLKEIHGYFANALYNDLSHDLALHRICSKIFAILDNAKKFNQILTPDE